MWVLSQLKKWGWAYRAYTYFWGIPPKRKVSLNTQSASDSQPLEAEVFCSELFFVVHLSINDRQFRPRGLRILAVSCQFSRHPTKPTFLWFRPIHQALNTVTYSNSQTSFERFSLYRPLPQPPPFRLLRTRTREACFREIDSSTIKRRDFLRTLCIYISYRWILSWQVRALLCLFWFQYLPYQ